MLKTNKKARNNTGFVSILFYNTRNSKGFTLLEVVIAIFLTIVGIVGLFVSINQTITISQVNSSKLIASYLVQEGIEVIRNIRDTNWLEEVDWHSNIVAGVSTKLDYESSDFPDLRPICTSGYLKLNNSLYNCSAGTDTVFTRTITIVDLEIYKMEVLVDVTWQERGKNYSISATEILYDWK